ncbi:MAG: hypothetical protein GF307_11270 [candidate division Zixibacteria bacterium]|nr:hypothetical protein [candidate division Zixibacteria bacterium]
MRIKHLGIIIISLLMLKLISEGSTDTILFPKEVEKTLELASENRSQLEDAIQYYSFLEDSLKMRAVFYLIENMEGHGYVTYALFDSTGNEINFNVLDYPDYPSLLASIDTLQSRHGELNFKKVNTIHDLSVISADFLIDNINYAFRALEEKTWAKYLSFNQFCEYILPYRGSNEPLELWREYFWKKYNGIEERMSNPGDIIEAAKIINEDIKSWFSFDSRFYYHPTDQGLSEMLRNRMGRCEDVTNLTIYAMRANGLAVTSDYTPYWANTGNNHAWNSILLADGKVVPFMGGESNPGEYRLSEKAAKVYRKMFSEQKGNLFFQERKQKCIPPWLSRKNYIDVTKDYVDVCDVTLTFDREIPDSVDIAYLCVFNSGEWKAIHWGRIVGNRAIFNDMGAEILYLPALYINENIEPIGDPFLIDSNCLIRKLQKQDIEYASIQLISTNPVSPNNANDDIEQSHLTPGREYELYYWRNKWNSLGKLVADDKPLVFEDIPSGCLYWLVAADSDREERPFTIIDDRQIWW